MTTRSTKPKISEESKEKIKQLETTDQLYRSHDAYIREQNRVQELRKRSYAKEVYESREEFISNVEKTSNLIDERHEKMINTIIKKYKNKFGTHDELKGLSYEELYKLHEKAKKKSFWSHLTEFLKII